MNAILLASAPSVEIQATLTTGPQNLHHGAALETTPLHRLLPIAVAVAVLLYAPVAAPRYRAPTRTPTQVAYAIGTVRPGLSKDTRLAWANVLVSVADEHNFDPLTGWAIIAHESRWRPDAVGGGKDIGLAQIRYTQSRRCKDGGLDSPECVAWRRALHDPATNMRQMANAITQWRQTCIKITGKADLKNVLQGYGGFSRWPSPKPRLCGRHKVKGRWKDLPVPKPVQDILNMRKRMIRSLAQHKIR